MVTFLEYRYFFNEMFHMINKQALVEVWCTLISLNFSLFQNIFASLKGPKMGLFRLKNFSWRPYTDSLHHVNIPLSYSALKTNEKSTPAFTQNHHGCLATRNGLVANDLLYLLSETIKICDIYKVCVLGWQCFAVHFKIETLYHYLASHTHYPQYQPCCEKHCVVA